jgi:NAD(P)-dependent dehydrogenase (short-subunit alcohol dehydrogenase family)
VVGGLYEGLCLAIAIRMARAGYPVCILHRVGTSRPGAEVAELRRAIEVLFHENAWPLTVERFDSTDMSSIARCAADVQHRHGPVEIVVSGEGTNAYPPRDFLAFNEGDWQQAIQRELMTDLVLLQTLLPHMRARHSGRILNLGYVPDYWNNHLPFHSGHPLFVNSWPFVLGKTWRKEICRQLAVSEYRYGITINTISPGRVRTLKLTQLATSFEAPVGSEASSWHVAELAHFLTTPTGSTITGAELPVLNRPLEYAFGTGHA